jgi:glycerol-3-phosphate dehydrogenase
VSTAALSREHAVRIEPSGLVTVAGGKWTTYRNMAEDCVDRAAAPAGLPRRRCVTRTLALHGSGAPAAGSTDRAGRWAAYGSDAPAVAALERDPDLARTLHPALPYTGADVVWAARNEAARTVEDVLARRTRALFLDADAAAASAEPAADLLARELGRDRAWRDRQIAEFRALAEGYRLRG